MHSDSFGRGVGQFDGCLSLLRNGGNNLGFLRGVIRVIIQGAVSLSKAVVRNGPFLLGPEKGDTFDPTGEGLVESLGFGVVSGCSPRVKDFARQKEGEVLYPGVDLIFSSPFSVKSGAFLVFIKEVLLVGKNLLLALDPNEG